MPQDQRRVRVSRRHLHRALQADVPAAVRKIKQHGVRCLHMQLLLQKAAVPHSPHAPVRRIHPEPAVILPGKLTGVVFRRLILPVVPSRRQGNLHTANRKTLPDIMAMSGDPQLLLQKPRHILGPVVPFCHISKPSAGATAVMVIITVGQQNAVQARNLLLCQRNLNQKRHVKAAEHRVHKNTGPPAVDHSPRTAQPADLRVFQRAKRRPFDVLRPSGHCLALFISPNCHTKSPLSL